MAGAAGLGAGRAAAGFVDEVELVEAGNRRGRQFVRQRAPGRWRIGHAQDELRQCVAGFGVQQPGLAFVVGRTRSDVAHGGRQAAIDQKSRTGFWLGSVAIRCHVGVDGSGVVAAIGIARNAIPVIGLSVAQTAHRHGQSGRNLRTAFNVADGGVEHPN